jgi:myosin heavy subunit
VIRTHRVANIHKALKKIPSPMQTSSAQSAPSTPAPDSADESIKPVRTDLALSEMHVVEAFSNLVVPEEVLRNSNVPKMVNDMRASQLKLESSEKRLARLREEKKDGNFLSNMWNERNDQIEDAESNLNGEFRKLGALSSNLLILNTAMAKIMNGQQRALQEQQVALNHQARDIKAQNGQLKEHQELHANTLREFTKVVEALKEAKSLTQTQAVELMKCAQKVADSEKNMLESHGRLMGEVEERLRLIGSDWSKSVATRLAEFDDVHIAVEKRLEQRLAASDADASYNFTAAQAHRHELDKKLESMAAREALLSRELEKQRKDMRAHQTVHALGGVAIVALFVWMVMGRAALPL